MKIKELGVKTGESGESRICFSIVEDESGLVYSITKGKDGIYKIFQGGRDMKASPKTIAEIVSQCEYIKEEK